MVQLQKLQQIIRQPLKNIVLWVHNQNYTVEDLYSGLLFDYVTGNLAIVSGMMNALMVRDSQKGTEILLEYDDFRQQ